MSCLRRMAGEMACMHLAGQGSGMCLKHDMVQYASDVVESLQASRALAIVLTVKQQHSVHVKRHCEAGSPEDSRRSPCPALGPALSAQQLATAVQAAPCNGWRSSKTVQLLVDRQSNVVSYLQPEAYGRADCRAPALRLWGLNGRGHLTSDEFRMDH
jgi:hypothetical protein